MPTTVDELLSQTSAATRFGHGQARFAKRTIVGLVRYDIHAQCRNVLARGRQLETCSPSAAVDDAADTGNHAPKGFDKGDDFIDRSSGRNNVLTHQNPFANCDLEAATELHCTGLTFGEHGAYAELPPDFLSDHDPSKGRRDHSIDPQWCELFGNDCTQCFGMTGVLQHLSALNVVRTVQTGGQLEVSFQECVCLFEEDKKLLGFFHGDE